jgi:hypothetical protein
MRKEVERGIEIWSFVIRLRVIGLDVSEAGAYLQCTGT